MIRAIKRRLVKYATKIYDPLRDIKIGNQVIKTFTSHPLRNILESFPEYNFNLPRIIKYVSVNIPDLKVIDIGANIGDTVAFIKNYTDVPVLCIDGDAKYIKLLKQNVAQYNNVSVCQAIVGSENKETNLVLKTEQGTGFLEESKSTIKLRTLENILEEFPAFSNAKILKSDTDGFDTIILRSCPDFLKRVKPILFFEFDPYLITKNNDDPFHFIDYLKGCGYYWFMFYINTGDYILSCSIEQRDIIDQLIHYFSGRNILSFTDVCAFAKDDKAFFDMCVKEEIAHFRKVRNY